MQSHPPPQILIQLVKFLFILDIIVNFLHKFLFFLEVLMPLFFFWFALFCVLLFNSSPPVIMKHISNLSVILLLNIFVL